MSNSSCVVISHLPLGSLSHFADVLCRSLVSAAPSAPHPLISWARVSLNRFRGCVASSLVRKQGKVNHKFPPEPHS